MYQGTFAWLLEDVGSVSSNTEVAALWMCPLVTDSRAVKHMVSSLSSILLMPGRGEGGFSE